MAQKRRSSTCAAGLPPPSLRLLSLCVLPAGASAGHSDGTGPKHDLVAGTGHIETGPIEVNLHVNAISDPGGEDPRGHFWFRGNPPPIGEIDVRGRVTCLRVTGTAATVGFEITRQKAGPAGPTGALFTIRDRGEPGAGVDQFEGFPTPLPPTQCPPPFGGRPITSGNFIVHGAG
jgi:hypothetical protein